MLGCGGRKRRCGKRYERRCKKVCWGVGEVRGDVGKGEGNEVREEMWGSVEAPYPNALPYTSPIPLSTCQHTSPLTPHTLPHIFPYLPTHFLTPPPHTSSHRSPHLPLHPNTLPHSPHALFHTSPLIFPHSFDYVAKIPCDDVALINLTGKAR